MYKIFKIVITAIFLTLSLFSKEIPLLDIVNPTSITTDKNNIYVLQGTEVFIFNQKDYKFIKKFGKTGEGPGEFRKSPAPWIPSLTLYITQNGKLLINSMGKVSFFSKTGEYISEKKQSGRIGRYIPLGKNFVKIGMDRDKNLRLVTATLFNEGFQKIKEFHRMPAPAQSGKKRNPVIMALMTTLFDKYSYKDKIPLSDPKGNFKIFDSLGNEVVSFKPEYSIIEPDPDFPKLLDEFFSADFRYKRPYTRDKQRGLIELPYKLPEFRDYRISNQKIYIFSNYKKEGKSEILIYSLDGKLIKKRYLELIQKDILNLFPFTVHEGKVFQIVTDEDEEECKLRITTI